MGTTKEILMGTTKSERKYGAKTDKVVATRHRKKKVQVEKNIRIMVDNANFLRERFATHKEAAEYIEKLQEKNKQRMLLVNYQII